MQKTKEILRQIYTGILSLFQVKQVVHRILIRKLERFCLQSEI